MKDMKIWNLSQYAMCLSEGIIAPLGPSIEFHRNKRVRRSDNLLFGRNLPSLCAFYPIMPVIIRIAHYTWWWLSYIYVNLQRQKRLKKVFVVLHEELKVSYNKDPPKTIVYAFNFLCIFCFGCFLITMHVDYLLQQLKQRMKNYASSDGKDWCKLFSKDGPHAQRWKEEMIIDICSILGKSSSC